MDANNWLLIVTAACSVTVADCNRNETTVLVSRRSSGDVFTRFDSDQLVCNVDKNHTFLAGDGQCVNNQELIRGITKYCSFHTYQEVVLI